MIEERRYPPEYWTDALRDICRDVCAHPYGEPPCWQDVDGSAPVGPCWSCVMDHLEANAAEA